MCSSLAPKSFPLPLGLGGVGAASALVHENGLPPLFDAGVAPNPPAALAAPMGPVLSGSDVFPPDEEDDLLRRIQRQRELGRVKDFERML